MKKIIIIITCLILILLVVINLSKIDTIGYNLISNLISENLTPIAKFITHFGGTICFLIISGLMLFLIKNKKIGISICTNLALIVFLNQLLKYIIKRPRPTEFRLTNASGYSFPSGHSMVSMAYYGLLIYLIYKKINNKCLKVLLIVLLSMLIGFIGLSRIYLGVHYTSDVLVRIFNINLLFKPIY